MAWFVEVSSKSCGLGSSFDSGAQENKLSFIRVSVPQPGN